jgi:hypothetical protein
MCLVHISTVEETRCTPTTDNVTKLISSDWILFTVDAA